MIHVIKLSLELCNLHVIVYAYVPHTRNMGKTYWYSFPIPWNKKNHWKQHTKLLEGTSILF